MWINALVQGAGGAIVSDTEAGNEAKVDIDSDAGRAAAEVIKQLADSPAAQPDFSVSNEGTSLGQMFPADGAGEFMTNWTFVYKNYEGLVGKDGGPADEEQFEGPRLGALPGDRRGRGSPSHRSAASTSGSAPSASIPSSPWRRPSASPPRRRRSTSRSTDGLMPSTNTAYEAVIEDGSYPADLVELWRTSVDEGGPRPKSAFYGLISSAIQARWHSPNSVDPDTTPKRSADYLQAVLEGKALL